MKRATTLILILLSVTILLSSCGVNADPQYVEPLSYQVKTDKDRYNYGEEITIELLFSVDVNGFYEKDNHTYCVKIEESPYYEIIGDSVTYICASEDKIEGLYSDYWYRAVFKIRVTEVYCGTHTPKIMVKCVDNDWLENEIPKDSIHRADSEFPFGIREGAFEFTAVEDGVEFNSFYTNAPIPQTIWQRFLFGLIDFVRYILLTIQNYII